MRNLAFAILTIATILTATGISPNLLTRLPRLPAVGQGLRLQLHIAGSVQRVSIGPYGRVLYQSIFCESTGTRRSLAASPRLLKLIL